MCTKDIKETWKDLMHVAILCLGEEGDVEKNIKFKIKMLEQDLLKYLSLAGSYTLPTGYRKQWLKVAEVWRFKYPSDAVFIGKLAKKVKFVTE